MIGEANQKDQAGEFEINDSIQNKEDAELYNSYEYLQKARTENLSTTQAVTNPSSLAEPVQP